jgi:hypothetical protein
MSNYEALLSYFSLDGQERRADRLNDFIALQPVSYTIALQKKLCPLKLRR